MGADLEVDAIERPHVDPATVAAALAYLKRTGNLDVAEALGLVEDPVIAARSRARALARVHHSTPAPPPVEVPPGHCPLCGNPIPRSGKCRKRQVCRDALVRADVEAADRLIDEVLSDEGEEL